MSKIIFSAHQPNFIPYLGFFDKMKKSDIFVIRDEVLFVKKEFHNRNRIRINSNDNINNPQSKWLTVPVIDTGDYIMHIPIKKESKIKNIPWNERILHDIKVNYENTNLFSEFFPELKKIFDNSDEKLISLNMKIINFLKNAFKISTKIVMASELGLKPPHYTPESNTSEDLAKICEVLDADVYLSGAGGKDYLDSKSFEKRGIKIIFQNYNHPIYPQRYPGFLPYMSALDALFCVGKLPILKEEKIKLKKEPFVIQIS